jgi:hypothetical protein
MATTSAQVLDTTKLLGADEISVPNASAVISNVAYKGALKTGYATALGIAESNFTKFVLSLARRLSATEPRRLSAGTIKVDYAVNLAGVKDAAAVATNAKAVKKETVTKNVQKSLKKVNYPDADKVVVQLYEVVNPPKTTTTTTLSNTTVVTTTSSWTAWDSSSGSSGSSSGSLVSSSGSLNTGSSLSGGSSLPGGSSESSGSTASGSSGSYMQIWQWLLLFGLCLLCCGGAGAAASMGGAKKPKKAKKKTRPAPTPVAEPVVPVVEEVVPLMASSTYMPTTSYAMPTAAATYAMPATTTYPYAAPVQFAATPYVV